MAQDRRARAREFLADLKRKTERALSRARTRSCRRSAASSKAPNAPSSQPWDVAYYAEKQRQALYDFDEEALRPYFPLERVVEGMFEIARRLFGIRVDRADGRAGLGPADEVLRDPRRGRHAAGLLLRRLVPAREQARRRLDGRASSPAWTAPAGFEPHLGADLRQPDAAGRRQARAADAPRGRDDLPRVRPPAAPLPEPRGGAQPGGHQRGLGLRRAALADHGELVLGARGAGPLRAALRDRRADPGGAVPRR